MKHLCINFSRRQGAMQSLPEPMQGTDEHRSQHRLHVAEHRSNEHRSDEHRSQHEADPGEDQNSSLK